MDDYSNGHGGDEMPEMDVAQSSYAGTDGTPGLKGLYVQPFSGGNMSSPIEKFMRGSNKPEEFIPLTNVQDWEITRDERILYFQNIANFANGKIQDVMLFGYNLRRAKNGQTASDVVAMVTGQRQKMQEEWKDRQNRIWQKSRGGLSGASEMAGGQ